ncbi:MAG: nucleotidyltransferase [Oscillospiraceae bacterium]|nr:nucleotidyltransferase [Oscillospiraceae bacterium]
MKKTALVIMAAGMGSRFGGLKQLTSVGPAGELIIDYSVYDAKRAGFDKVYFIIKEQIADEFKEKIGNRISNYIETDYIYQETYKLPEGFKAPSERTKPWGTGHAIWCGADIIKEPFMVINADDYYGHECFKQLHDFLVNADENDSKMHIAMAGFMLCNTITKNGYNSRGVCTVDANGMLESVVERTHIEYINDKIMFTEDGGETYTALPDMTPVSMNCWAFPNAALKSFESQLIEFLEKNIGEMKAEFYLPSVVSRLIDEGKADVKVLETGDKWHGITYPDDLKDIVKALNDKMLSGEYPAKLWD